ncbi:MAG: glycosyltransferase family 4 protein [Bacteroidaceae bacterium]|nr:glycosyltransferase family 4 protein [Bacteroidaceae bacterium]
MNTIITILDSITETSMPFNEFVLYRANHFKDERQLLVVCDSPKSLPKIRIPENLEIMYIGINPLKWRGILKNLLSRYDKESYVIHLHQAGTSMKVLLLMLGTGFRKKVVFTVHSTFTGYKLHNKIRSYISGLLSSYIVCCSNTSYANYPNSLKRLKGHMVLPIQNGVDTDRIDKIREVWVPNVHDGVIFAYVARMVPVKNHDFLIDIAKRTSPPAKFLLIGKTDNGIIQRIKAEGLDDRIECTGLVTRNEVFERLMNADVYLSTSTLEGLPVSVLEGMYTGMPAVLSDIPQHREVAEDKEFVTILPFDEGKWTREINKYTEMSKEQLIRLGVESSDYIKEKFSLAAMHKKYDEIYERIRG